MLGTCLAVQLLRLPSDAEGAGLIPGGAAKIPRVLNQNIKPYCNKFNKDLKNGAHQKQNGNKKQNKANP